MVKKLSKSKFKPQALEYFREIEQTGTELIITDRGKPVLKIVPYRENAMDGLKTLRNSVLKYDDPTGPAGLEDWDSLQ